MHRGLVEEGGDADGEMLGGALDHPRIDGPLEAADEEFAGQRAFVAEDDGSGVY